MYSFGQNINEFCLNDPDVEVPFREDFPSGLGDFI